MTRALAAQTLDLSVRQISKLVARFRAGGSGINAHQARGRASNR
jgi:transposase